MTKRSHTDIRKSYLRPIMGGAVLFGFVSWLLLGEFGANLFTDALAAAFAIYVIDEVTARAERARLKNMATVMAARLFSIRAKVFQLFKKFAAAALKSTDLPDLQRAAALRDLNVLAAILDRVNTHDLAGWMARLNTLGFHQTCRWGDVFREEMEEVSRDIDSFITQFGQYSPPDLVAALGTLARQRTGKFVSADGSAPIPLLDRRGWLELLSAHERLGTEIELMKSEFEMRSEPDELSQLAFEPLSYLLHNFASLLSGQRMYRDLYAFKPSRSHTPYSPGHYSNSNRRTGP